MRTSAERRHNDWNKAVRKRSISRHAYGFDWYRDLHRYDKGKIHCSCPMCASKTNNRNFRCYGPVLNLSLMDQRRMDAMKEDLRSDE